MSVIFQLFCAEDLQRLNNNELQMLKAKVTGALKEALKKPKEDRLEDLCLKITDDPTLRQEPSRKVIEALNKRFHEVSNQLKSSQINQGQPTWDFEERKGQRNTQTPEESTILRWALACEVQNFEFYYPILKAKVAAYRYFEEAIKEKMRLNREPVPDKVRPIGPDSPYSPFNPRHPLYKLFYDY